MLDGRSIPPYLVPVLQNREKLALIRAIAAASFLALAVRLALVLSAPRLGVPLYFVDLVP